MDDKNAIVLARNIQTETVVQRFFVDAYRIARGDDAAMKEQDSERVQGCAVHALHEHKLDPSNPIEMRRAATIVGNFLSLGLEEAAEGDLEAAVNILRRHPIEKLYELGRSLHDEIRKDAKKILDENILKINDSFYSIIDRDLEEHVREIGRENNYFCERHFYQAALAILKKAKTHLKIATAFPLVGMFEQKSYGLDHYQDAYKRKSKTEFAQSSGLLSLVMRSYLVKALTVEPGTKLPDKCGGENKPFQRIFSNFIVKTNKLKALVENVFFEPRKVGAEMAECITALNHYLDFKGRGMKPMSFWFSSLVFSQPPLPREVIDEALEYATDLLKQFVESVLKYFQTVDEVDVSDASIAKFWANWIICYQVGSNVDQELKKIADKINPEAVLKAPPNRIAEYVANAHSWPEDYRERVIANYDWRGFYRSALDDNSISRALNIILKELGWRIMVPSFNTPRGHISFWMHVWGMSSPAAHDEILKYMEQADLKINPQILSRALEQTPGLGKDERLLRLLVAMILKKQQSDDEKIHNCSADIWNSIICSLWRFDCIEDTKTWPFIARYIPETTLMEALAKITGTNRDSIVSALASGIEDEK